jgi:hypothetical protein
MLSSESLEIGNLFSDAVRDRYGDEALATRFPRVRHDLQRDAGPSGRHPGAAGRAADGPDDRDRRLQQQQHAESARICAEPLPTYHVAEPSCLRSASEIAHRPVGTARGNNHDGVAAARPAVGRADIRRLNSGQYRRTGHPPGRVFF